MDNHPVKLNKFQIELMFFFMARVADKSERYEDMVAFLKEIVQENSREMIIDDSNFLKAEFMNFTSSLRFAWKTE